MSMGSQVDPFASVLGAGRGQAPITSPASAPGSAGNGTRPIVASDLLGEFIESCSTVVEVVLGREDAPVPLDGIPYPAAVFKAYLLFLACYAPESENWRERFDWGERLDSFCECLLPEVSELLGFDGLFPTRFEVELAFAAFAHASYEESELRAFMLGVELFAISGLFRELAR